MAEKIARQILRSILDRTLRPGDRLPSERSLSSRLGVNRASLREAIKSLEQLGLVHTRQGDGTRVMDFMSHAGVELLQHLLPLAVAESPELLGDLQEVRVVLGREVARLAARRAEPEDLVELRRTCKERGERQLSPRELLKLDMEVFAGLARASHNRVVQLLVNSIRSAVALQPDLFAPLMPSPELVFAHHQALIERLAAQDAEGAAALTESFLSEMETRVGR
ncbi:MAG: GntR family transcriptional regulator [Polyangia bacterium]|nr:GntR family transcriptional regulator [Polyangia bacterium]